MTLVRYDSLSTTCVCVPTIQVGPTHIALHLLPPEQQKAGQHRAAQTACEGTAAGGQQQVRTAKRTAPSSAASEKKQVRKTELLRTGSIESPYSARPRRAAAAAAIQGIHLMATSNGEEEDASDGEPPAVGKAGSVSAGKEVRSAPGSRGTVLTSAAGEPFGGWVDVMGLGGGRSAAAAGGGGGEAEEAGAAQDHLYAPARARPEAAAPAANGSPFLPSKGPCASRVCSHLSPSNSTQKPTVSACRANLLPFSSTGAAPGGEVVGSFNTMAAVAARLDVEEQHVEAPAEPAIGSLRLPAEPAFGTLGVEVKPSSSGPVLAVAAPAATAVGVRQDKGGGRESRASVGTVPQGRLGTVVVPLTVSSPKDGMLQGSAVCCREGGAANPMAVAAEVGRGDKGGVGSLQLAGPAPALSRRGEVVYTSVPVTLGVKPEPSVDALAEVSGTRVQPGKGNAALPSAATARGLAARPVAGVAVEVSAALSPSLSPSIASSPKGDMLEGSAACLRQGTAHTMAVATGVGDRDKGGIGSLQLAGAALVLSKKGETADKSALATSSVKSEPFVCGLAEVSGNRVQLGKGNAAPPLAATAKGSAATPVAGAAEASAPVSPSPPLPPAAAAADANADAALPVTSPRATVAPATATAGAAPPAASAAATTTTTAFAPITSAAPAEAEPAPPAAAEAKPRQSTAAAAAGESQRATKAAAWDAPCGIKTPANEAGPPGLGSKLQLHLNHAAVPKAVKTEDCLQERLRAVQLPAAAVAATAAAAGSRASVGMKSRRVPTAAVPTGADTMPLPEHGVFTGAVDQVEAAGALGAKQYGIKKQARPKVSLSKNSSGDAGGNGLGGDGGEGNGGVGLPVPSDTALEGTLRAAGIVAVRNGSSGKGGMGAPRGERRLGLITAAVKAEPTAAGGKSASVPATAAAQGPSLPPAAGLAFPAAVIVPPLPVIRGGKSPMPAPAAVVVEREAPTAGGSLFPHAAAGAVAQQVKYEKPAPQADDAAAMGSASASAPAPIAAADAASAPAPAPMNIATTAAPGPNSAIGRTAAPEGFIAAIEGAPAAATAAANGARRPAEVGVQNSAGTQAAAIATTAAARRARGLHSVPMHAATAAEVIVIDDSDDESAGACNRGGRGEGGRCSVPATRRA